MLSQPSNSSLRYFCSLFDFYANSLKKHNRHTLYLSIIVLFQVVSQFSNFLNFGEEGEKRLVGLRLASAAGNYTWSTYYHF